MRDVALAPLLVSAVIFVFTYAGIFSERVHRTIVSLAGAVAMIALGSWFSFYDMHKAVEAIDFNTITLLLGMMIVVTLSSTIDTRLVTTPRYTSRSHGFPPASLAALIAMY